uniref:Uncharacterized protein n=1 Tax=Timema tahoe TaxID=61484 RepID=A0A7R9FNB0_9NEOP|nr:unnamed protein product [Timema tahoe]
MYPANVRAETLPSPTIQYIARLTPQASFTPVRVYLIQENRMNTGRGGILSQIDFSSGANEVPTSTFFLTDACLISYSSRDPRVLVRLTEDVARKKTEYQKYLESYKQMRAKFEEQFVIKLGRGSRRLDDVRDRVQKACRKLHLTHNEYVLLLCEAVEYEKDFRTVLLPGLLEYQQAMQEAFILAWRSLLQEVTQLFNYSSDNFKEIQSRIESSIDSIRPHEEYSDFTERHKTSPASPVPFTFDDTLVEDTSGKLLPNTLTVDNLTVEWLRNKLSELETSVRDTQEKMALTEGRQLSTVDSIKKETNELHCHERKLQRQIDMINGALKDLGCEEVPSGCDLSIETTFVDSPEHQQPIQQQDDRSSLTLKKQQQRLVNMLRKPFRRKLSATSSPLLARCGGGTEEDGGGDVKEAGEEDKVCQGHGDGDLTLLTISDCDECRDNSNYSSCDNGCYLVVMMVQVVLTP